MVAPQDGHDTAVRERRVLTGLACEWALAADELETRYRQRLARPLFRLADAPGFLGQWNAARREICLNRQLALTHPWDDVRDVLRHEMAHQLAESVLGADGQPPHGPAFQQACLMLRVDPAAAGRRPLHARLARLDPSQENPRHGRIRKLLALARSQNPNEAEAAMLKAHELMARHHITTLTRDPRRRFVSIFLGKPALRHFKETYYLANLLQDFYFVQGIWVPAFVVAREKMGRVHEISGTHANVAQADYVYAFVNAYIDRRWSELGAGQRLTRYQKSDFAVGIIEGFRRKLEREQLAADRPSEYALISRCDPRLCTYLRQRYPRTSQIQRGGGRHDPDIYGRGRQIGEQMILHRGIVHRSGDVKHRLPPA